MLFRVRQYYIGDGVRIRDTYSAKAMLTGTPTGCCPRTFWGYELENGVLCMWTAVVTKVCVIFCANVPSVFQSARSDTISSCRFFDQLLGKKGGAAPGLPAGWTELVDPSSVRVGCVCVVVRVGLFVCL